MSRLNVPSGGRSLRIAVSSVSFSKNVQLLAELASCGVEVVANRDGLRMDEDALIRFWTEGAADGAIVGLEPVSDRVLQECPRVRIVAKYGVGLDNLDLGALERRGVTLGWTPGVNRRSVTELTLAFALGHSRNVFRSVRRMMEGAWNKDGGRQLSDLRFGIVGLGCVGTDVARVLRAFGTETMFNDIEDRSDVAAELSLVPMDYFDLLSAADIVSFHVPSTPSTKGMFGEREIALAGAQTLVINTARGPIVHFDAAVAAVRDGRLGGYATDVYPVEPMDVSHLSTIDGLYFTPHIGGNAAEAVLAMGRSAIEHVRTFAGARAP